MDIVDLWDEVLNVIKAEVTEVSFNTWIKSIVPVSISEKDIVLGVPDFFIKDIITNRYHSLLKNCIKSVLSKELDLDVFIMGEEDGKLADLSDDNEANINDEYINNTLLNPKYSFETFVVGNSNSFAHAASLAVAESPAKAYNPLFLYGGVGLGKTHLMHAIGHFILQQDPSTKVVYVTSERFTNELINSLKDGKNEEFRSKYRDIDVLLVDDIQFIAGKERTQEEFFHTFNTLHDSNKQIILTSDRPPKEINTLEERLRSRFECGLIGDIQSPDLETRIAILKKKAQTEKFVVSNDILVYIAEEIKSNIRELEGALNRIMAFNSLAKQEITQEIAEEALKEFLLERKKEITIPLIQEKVAEFFDLKIDDFISSRRTKNIAYPRQIAMYLCRQLTELSLPKIGQDFGGRDHTTVIHAVNKIEKEAKTDEGLKNTLNELTTKIQN